MVWLRRNSCLEQSRVEGKVGDYERDKGRVRWWSAGMMKGTCVPHPSAPTPCAPVTPSRDSESGSASSGHQHPT